LSYYNDDNILIDLDITDKIQQLPEINIELNEINNMVVANPLNIVLDNTNDYFYGEDESVFNTERQFFLSVVLSKYVYDSESGSITDESTIVFKGVIDNSSIVVNDNDVIQCSIVDYFQYILEQPLINRKYYALFGGRPDIDIKKTLDYYGIDYEIENTISTENWL